MRQMALKKPNFIRKWFIVTFCAENQAVPDSEKQEKKLIHSKKSYKALKVNEKSPNKKMVV